MKTKYSLGISLIIASLLTGCGGSDSGSSSNVSGEAVSITTKEEAVSAFSAVTSIKSMGSSSFSSTSSDSITDSISLSSKRGPSLVPVNETENCTSGGTISYSGDSEITSGDVTITYNNCVESDGTTTNGTQRAVMSMDGNSIDLKMTMTDFKVATLTDSSTMNMTMTAETESLTSGIMDIKMNGTLSYSTTSPIIDSGTAGYENFHIATKAGGYIEVDGKASITSSAYPCSNGSYTFETKEDLHASSNGFDSGILEVNNVSFEFNSDGTSTVTFADGTTSIIDQTATATCSN